MRVLIIDDCYDSCAIIQGTLSPLGYEVTCCHSGTQALEIIDETQPHLAIIDVVLPDMSGHEICRYIRANSNIPIVMISAVSRQVEDIVTGLDIGADIYLT